MLSRCYNKNNPMYLTYGGNGIEVSKEWLESFENFYRDMEETWSENLEIDRINPYSNYCKDNCRWVSKKENCSRVKRERFPRLASGGNVNKTMSFRVSEKQYEKFISHLNKKNISISDFFRIVIDNIPPVDN